MIRLTFVLSTLALLAPGALAQNINIDFGDPNEPAGVASSSYGAAAGQSGVWNGLTTGPGLMFDTPSLLDVNGTMTSVSLITTSFAFDINDIDNPLTMGDDEALLDDLADAGMNAFNFSGLMDGDYTIYTYAFTPDDPTRITTVTPTGGTTNNGGGADWTGAHVFGETYTTHDVTVSGGSLVMNIDFLASFGSVNGFQIVMRNDFTEACFGDGGVQMGCTDCPCGNNAAPGTLGGCVNSASRSGRLLPSGDPSVGMDTLRFEMSGGTSGSFAILSSGNALAPANAVNPCFGLNSGIQSPVLDGLRCAVQSVQRHGTRPTDANGDVGVTTNGWGPPNGPAGGLIAQGGFMAGQTRHYQAVYRDVPTGGCGTGQNTTQAVSVTFSN